MNPRIPAGPPSGNSRARWSRTPERAALAPVLALVLLACDEARLPNGNEGPEARVTLKGKAFTVSMVLTEKDRRYATERFRTLPEDEGYLLAWPRPRYMKLETMGAAASFDVLFLDATGRIVDEQSFVRGRDEGIMPEREANYALFLTPGTVKTLKVKKGETVDLSPAVRDAVPGELPVVRIGDATAYVELAHTAAERNHGLMFRPRMSENDGMLFIYEDEGPRSFWMKNTLIPLDLGFFRSDGTMLNVNDTPMWPDPRSEPITHPTSDSDSPARCVLEMNRGWFRKNGLLDAAGRPKPGLKVVFPSEAYGGFKD